MNYATIPRRKYRKDEHQLRATYSRALAKELAHRHRTSYRNYHTPTTTIQNKNTQRTETQGTDAAANSVLPGVNQLLGPNKPYIET